MEPGHDPPAQSDPEFGVPPGDWERLKAEIRDVLVEVARERTVITYVELTARLEAARLEPNAPLLARLLRQISEAEDAAGRGLLTAVVVRFDRRLPGKGFFELARLRGRNVDDVVRFWQDERDRVYAAWKA